MLLLNVSAHDPSWLKIPKPKVAGVWPVTDLAVTTIAVRSASDVGVNTADVSEKVKYVCSVSTSSSRTSTADPEHDGRRVIEMSSVIAVPTYSCGSAPLTVTISSARTSTVCGAGATYGFAPGGRLSSCSPRLTVCTAGPQLAVTVSTPNENVFTVLSAAKSTDTKSNCRHCVPLIPVIAGKISSDAPASGSRCSVIDPDFLARPRYTNAGSASCTL